MIYKISLIQLYGSKLTVRSSNHFAQDGISLLPKLFCIMTFHMLFEIANIIVLCVAYRTNMLRILAIC